MAALLNNSGLVALTDYSGKAVTKLNVTGKLNWV